MGRHALDNGPERPRDAPTMGGVIRTPAAWFPAVPGRPTAAQGQVRPGPVRHWRGPYVGAHRTATATFLGKLQWTWGKLVDIWNAIKGLIIHG